MRFAGFVLFLVTVTAHAEPRFEEFAKGQEPRKATQLAVEACTVDVELRGGLALIEERVTISNRPGTDPHAVREVGALYERALPARGVVTGFAVQAGKTTTPGIFLTTLPSNTRSAEELTDPAILLGRDGGYLVVVQPVARGTEMTLIVKYSAPVEIRGGALSIVLPPGPARCDGRLRASAGPGASVTRILVDGEAPSGLLVDIDAPRRRNWRGGFETWIAPVRLAAELAFAREQPVVWTQSQKLSDGAATLVTVAAPLQKVANLAHRRVLFVIDGSRSMQLVGAVAVREAVSKIVLALPANTPVEAILFDRTATRVLGSFQPATPAVVGALGKQISLHVPSNGSDLVAAFQLAHKAMDDGQPDSTLVVVISDGVLGDVPGQALVTALDAKTSTVDVLSIALDPAQTRAPDIDALRAPVSVLGGSLVEVEVSKIDDALLTVSEWLRPAWHDVTLGTSIEVPSVLRAGSGFVSTVIDTKPVTPILAVRSGEKTIAIRSRAAASAPIAPVVLAVDGTTDAKHPYATLEHSFAVLATNKDKRAAARAQLARAGGAYLRVISVDDPAALFTISIGTSVGPSAIDKSTLTRLFREHLQPRAYACYQRALGLDAALAGTVRFTFVLGRGEVTRVDLFGLGNASLDACLLDAAYTMNLPFPDFSINSDDQTIANYPLTLQISQRKAVVVAGDADSASPIDVDAIKGGVPASAKRPIKVDAATPLGTLKPSK